MIIYISQNPNKKYSESERSPHNTIERRFTPKTFACVHTKSEGIYHNIKSLSCSRRWFADYVLKNVLPTTKRN